MWSSLLLAATSLLALPANAVSLSTLNLTLSEQLELTSSQADRIELLASKGGNKSFEFDFNESSNNTNGSVVTAVGTTFPALIGLDIAVFKFTLGPCGLIVPHTHPRSDEFVVVTEGTVTTQFLAEAGTEVYTATNMTEYRATIFPKGSVHTEWNPTCSESIFLGTFNSNDPGTVLVAPALFGLNQDVLGAQLDGVVNAEDISSIRHALPPDIVWSIDSCMKRCNISQ